MDPADAPLTGPRALGPVASGPRGPGPAAVAPATRLAPEQRLFVAWVAHLVRARLHLVDAYADAVADADDPAARRRDAESIRRLVRSLLAQLDELTGAPAPGPRPAP